jgi:hypothetical protein
VDDDDEAEAAEDDALFRRVERVREDLCSVEESDEEEPTEESMLPDSACTAGRGTLVFSSDVFLTLLALGADSSTVTGSLAPAAPA